MPFTEVDLSDGHWVDYDEKVRVSATNDREPMI